MACYASTMIKDGSVTTSDFGTLKGDKAVFLVTGAGRYVRIYSLNEHISLVEEIAIPLPSEIVSVKFVRIPGHNDQSIIALTKEGVLNIIRYDVGSQRIVLKPRNVVLYVPISNSTIDYIANAGIFAVVSSLAHVTFINLATPEEYYNVKTSTPYATAITIISENCLAVMESDNGVCSLKVFKFNIEDRTEAMNFNGEREYINLEEYNELMRNDGSILPVEIFSHRLSNQSTTMLKVSGPAEGLLIFSDKDVTHIPMARILSDPTKGISQWNHPMTNVTCYTKKSDKEYFIGSARRDLFLVTLVNSEVDPSEVATLCVHSIRRGPMLSTLSIYNEALYAGSPVDNSTLLIIAKTTANEGVQTYKLIPKQSFENLGPVRDMVVVKDQDRPKMITLSGQGVDCFIRVLQDALTENRVATVQCLETLPFERVFVLRMGLTADTWILVSSDTKTELYQVPHNRPILRDQQFFETGPTLLAADLSPFVLQITSNLIRILFHTMDSDSGQTWIKWGNVDTPLATIPTALLTVARQKAIMVASKRDLQLFQIRLEADEVTPRLDHLITRTLPYDIMCLEHYSSTAGGTNLDFVLIGLKKSKGVLVFNLESMAQISLIPFPENVHSAHSIIAKGTDLLFSNNDGAYHNNKFNPLVSTSGSFKKVPNCNHFVKFSHVKTQEPGLAATSMNGGFLVEKFGNLTRYPGLPSMRMCTGFQGSHFANHLVVVGHSDFSISTVIRRTPKFAAREQVTKIANEGSQHFGVLTHRIDYANVENEDSFSRLAEREYCIPIARTANRNQKWDESFAKKNDKPFSSAVFLSPADIQPKCFIRFGSYECPKQIANGTFEGDDVHYYAISTELAYPEKEQYGTVYLFCVTLGPEPTINLIYKDEISTPGEAGCLYFCGGYLFASFGYKQLRYGFDESKQFYRDSDNEIDFTTVGGSDIRIATSSTTEDLLRGDQNCPVMTLAAGNTPTIWATSCLSTTHIIGIGNEMHLTMMQTRSQQGEPLAFEGNFFLGCIPSSLKEATCQSQDLNCYYSTGNQLVYTTETGSIGVVMRLEEQWASILNRVCAAIVSSDLFKNTYSMFEYLFFRRLGNTGFVDGDMIQALLRMQSDDIRAILQDVTLEHRDGCCRVVDHNSLYDQLMEFASAANIIYMNPYQA